MECADGAARYQVRYRYEAGADSVSEWFTRREIPRTRLRFKPAGKIRCAVTYRFQVRAYGDGVTKFADYGEPSEETLATDACLSLGAPVVSGSVAPTRMTLRWEAVAGASGYEIRRRESGEQWSPKLASTPRLHGVVDNLTRQRTYQFQVRAVGNGTTHAAGPGGWPAEITTSTGEPPAPAGVRVSGSTEGSISLAWDVIDGAAFYQVQRRTAGNAEWATGPETAGAVYTVTGLPAETGYVFRVRAKGDGIRYIDIRPWPWSVTVRGTTTAAAATG